MTRTITEVDWSTREPVLQDIRRQVFVDEQGVSPELEWDGEDAGARHWLALDSEGQPAGTVRMLTDGHIGRMAVLKPLRGQGYGSGLLKAALAAAQDSGLDTVYLHAQTHALPFYERFGFVAHGPEFDDAGIPHRSMRLVFNALRRGHHRVTPAAMPETALALARQSRRQLRVLSLALEPEVYDSEDWMLAASALARRHRDTKVRLLVLDDRALISRGHRLLGLQRRLPSHVLIRALDKHTQEDLPELFLIADRNGILINSRLEPDTCHADYDNRPLVKPYIELFDRLWSQSLEIPELKTLMI